MVNLDLFSSIWYWGKPITHLLPLTKSKFNLKSDRVNRLVLLSVCFINTMSRRYSTNWDRKGWPGSEIQMYNGCPCTAKVIKVYGFSAQLWWLRTALISRFYILLWLRKKYTQMHCLNIEVLHSAMAQKEIHPDAVPQYRGSTFCHDSERNTPRFSASI